MALVLVGLFRRPVLQGSQKTMKLLIAGVTAMALGLLLFVEWFPFPADIDAHNLESGIKNAYTMLGCLVGVAVVYIVDSKYLHFETKAVWWVQLLKALVGLGLVLIVKSVLKAPLDALFSGHMAARAVRYFFIVIVAGIIWPLSFRWFAKLGQRKDT